MNRDIKKMIWLVSAVVLLTLWSATREYAKSQTNYKQNEMVKENQEDTKYLMYKTNIFQHELFTANLMTYNIAPSGKVKEIAETEKEIEADELTEEIEITIEPEEIYTATELEILYRITESEASGEGEFGKTLVANVILNRVHSDKFPNSIEEVVFQRNHGVQFSPIVNGRYCSVSVTDETREAVHKALKEDYTNGALYFRMTKGSKGNWHDRNLQKVFSHGNHTFYR